MLLSAAGLWVTGAIPAFAVSLAVIALQIALLGDPSGPFADGDRERWQRFVAPWASPVMWLFLSGLVLASAASRTGLDLRMADAVLRLAGRAPSRVLLAIMGVTFVLSMFMSNTATAAMMIALVCAMPVVKQGASSLATALLLGVSVAANIGGMGTIIGTPPNAIAVAALTGSGRPDFASWMMYGVPPALLLGAIAWQWLAWRYLRDAPLLTASDAAAMSITAVPTAETAVVEIAAPASASSSGRGLRINDATAPDTQRLFVAGLFLVTVIAWVTEAVHGIPTAVVAVMPIAVLAVSGVVTAREIRSLPWDVLILLAGGLSLGVGVSESGLASWLVSRVPVGGLPTPLLALLIGYTGLLLSTFISNTAAATILTPLALALAAGHERLIVIPLALAMSASMSLPVSTPPTALAYATGRLSRRDVRGIGLVLAALTAPVAVSWTWVVERWLR